MRYSEIVGSNPTGAVMTEEQKNKIKFIKLYIKLAKKMGWCIQCQHPWYDGLCECIKSNPIPEIVNLVDRIGNKLCEELWDAGDDLEHYL